MNFGSGRLILSNVHRGIVYDILSRYRYDFYAFGSRVKGTHHKYSDLDLCYREEIPKSVVSQIKEDLSESNLPFTVDIVDFNLCDEDFQALIKKDMVKIPAVIIKTPETKNEWSE